MNRLSRDAELEQSKKRKAEAKELQAELHARAPINDDYLNGRSRFFATCIRDKYGDILTQADKDVIQKDNEAAHHGDLWVDGIMLRKNIAPDPVKYKHICTLLYGISPEEVLHYCM